jgi:hypothetical protein
MTRTLVVLALISFLELGCATDAPQLTNPEIARSSTTIGYQEGMRRLTASCLEDVNKFCKKIPLGGGRARNCLEQNRARLSSQCATTMTNVIALWDKRATARANVRQICAADQKKLCPEMQEGDGNVLECYMKAKQNASVQCQQAVLDAGYE